LSDVGFVRLIILLYRIHLRDYNIQRVTMSTTVTLEEPPLLIPYVPSMGPPCPCTELRSALGIRRELVDCRVVSCRVAVVATSYQACLR
jgi:hypothetical protein